MRLAKLLVEESIYIKLAINMNFKLKQFMSKAALCEDLEMLTRRNPQPCCLGIHCHAACLGNNALLPLGKNALLPFAEECHVT